MQPDRNGIRRFFTCRRVAFLLGLIVIVLLTVFRYGNPQWNILIYRFQAEIYPRYEACFIPPPDNYTGNWRIYMHKGMIDGFDGGELIITYQNGLPLYANGQNQTRSYGMNFLSGKRQ